MAVPAATASAKTTISMSGSTSVAPLAAKLAKGYLKAHPGSVSFRLAQGGSDVGVADVAAGRVSIGNSSRDPKGSDPGGLVWSRIARDAICIATNANNPVSGLTQAQVQAIFSGQVRNWSQVPGASADTRKDQDHDQQQHQLALQHRANGTRERRTACSARPRRASAFAACCVDSIISTSQAKRRPSLKR